VVSAIATAPIDEAAVVGNPFPFKHPLNQQLHADEWRAYI